MAHASGIRTEGLETANLTLSLEQADRMIENVVGIYGLPLAIATNFIVNGRDVLVPMVIEEPSVVAGAGKAAKTARAGGGFQAEATSSLMIGQIQVLDLEDLEAAAAVVLDHEAEILAAANTRRSAIIERGGGAKGIEVRAFPETPAGPMLVVHLLYDVLDAMGANAVNSTVEALAPLIEGLTGGRVNLRILSNLADRRLARAWVTVAPECLASEGWPGDEVVRGIVEAYALAAVDPYRAATHNKGIMNGVDSVAVATGNDWRALEAGAHAYASRAGTYEPLSRWERATDGSLEGYLEMPMPVGVVGGATKVHPTARLSLEIMGVVNASELAEIMAAVGLAQNLAALWALATEGIQRGHMSLNTRKAPLAVGGDEKAIRGDGLLI